ncbi:DUF3078 domain-containing protein [Plebeiibacterium sediminum]|uniref:DUF3078 domain-containing protein n=1 Tax=Plebeiibacterium sediminum TaxID=2992112 RepID=A0AAE3SGK9_9BACT|nr:DUF3078 domain-containing protein [Plebeiobacterium sediminum]MCW3788593.1 DUF3078 domain-containing protein [Plebeiobacterium sediminum]
MFKIGPHSSFFSKFSLFPIVVLFLYCTTLEAQDWNKINNSAKPTLQKSWFQDDLNYNIKKWGALKLDYRFFILDSTEYYRNQAWTLIPHYRKYKDFVMSLKYYPDSSLSVNFKPTLVDKELLNESRGYFSVLMSNTEKDFDLSSTFDLKKENEKIFIENPDLVKHVWKTIPEPHRLITDRRHLNKRSAEEGIRSLLSNDIKYPDKLKEKTKVKGPWTLSGTESIQLSQAFLENWTKGGENSISLLSDLLLNANYKKNKNEWENYIRHQIGIISSESYATQINNDQIEMNSKYGLKASKKWYYSALFNFKSQFFNGYNNKNREEIISGFLSPAYFTGAIGMDFKKDKVFTLLLSPFTAKLTYVMDTAKVDQTKYKIDENKRSSFSNGASIVNKIDWKISTELSLISNLDAYVSYFTKESLKQIDWELIFNMRVNRFLSTRINTKLRYFTNESENIQFKENFTISFNYKF